VSFLNIKKLEENIMEEKIKELENRIAVLETTVTTQEAMISAINATTNTALDKSIKKELDN